LFWTEPKPLIAYDRYDFGVWKPFAESDSFIDARATTQFIASPSFYHFFS